MPFPVSPNPGDSYTDAYGTVWIYAGSVNGWYRQTVIPGNETSYTAGLITTDKIIDNTIINADVASNAAIAGTKISPNFGSQNVTTTGTSTAASFIPTSSTAPTNGLYLSAANSVALSTNGNGRLFIDSSGNVGVGTAPDQRLTIASAGSTTLNIYGQGRAAAFSVGVNATGALINEQNNLPLVFNTNNTERARIDSSGTFRVKGAGTGGVNDAVQLNGSAPANSLLLDASGRLLVGTASSINTVIQAGLQLQSSGANAYLSVGRWDNNAANPGFVFNKSRGASPGTRAVVQAEDFLGQIAFTGDDGSAFVFGAEIRAAVDGTPGANDMPGRLVFSTTADGAASPTERLRITSAGVLQVADAGNIAVGTTTGTKIGTATTQKLGFFNKTPVVQPAAVADATDAASVITQLNALLARMRDLGLIAT